MNMYSMTLYGIGLPFAIGVKSKGLTMLAHLPIHSHSPPLLPGFLS